MMTSKREKREAHLKRKPIAARAESMPASARPEMKTARCFRVETKPTGSCAETRPTSSRAEMKSIGARTEAQPIGARADKYVTCSSGRKTRRMSTFPGPNSPSPPRRTGSWAKFSMRSTGRSSERSSGRASEWRDRSDRGSAEYSGAESSEASMGDDDCMIFFSGSRRRNSRLSVAALSTHGKRMISDIGGDSGWSEEIVPLVRPPVLPPPPRSDRAGRMLGKLERVLSDLGNEGSDFSDEIELRAPKKCKGGGGRRGDREESRARSTPLGGRNSLGQTSSPSAWSEMSQTTSETCRNCGGKEEKEGRRRVKDALRSIFPKAPTWRRW